MTEKKSWRTDGNDATLLKCWKKKLLNPNFLQEIKTFSNRGKLREFIAGRTTVKEWPKEALQTKWK